MRHTPAVLRRTVQSRAAKRHRQHLASCTRYSCLPSPFPLVSGRAITKNNAGIESYYTTPFDDFKYRQYQKTTNKRGCVVDMAGEEITISVKTDNNEFEAIDTYLNIKGYIVSRIKKKKWKEIQLKFSSDKPFSLYSATLESYVGGYVKR